MIDVAVRHLRRLYKNIPKSFHKKIWSNRNVDKKDNRKRDCYGFKKVKSIKTKYKTTTKQTKKTSLVLQVSSIWLRAGSLPPKCLRPCTVKVGTRNCKLQYKSKQRQTSWTHTIRKWNKKKNKVPMYNLLTQDYITIEMPAVLWT